MQEANIINNLNRKNMTTKQVISKLNDFLAECMYKDGFISYAAYDYIFGDADFKERILEDGKYMSIDGFKDWLSDYILEHRNDYERLNIEGTDNDIYVNIQ